MNRTPIASRLSGRARNDRNPAIFLRMNRRNEMTGRRVAQGSREAGEARVGGSIDERLELVSALSLSTWMNSGRPLPVYRREEMPIHRTTLHARRDRD